MIYGLWLSAAGGMAENQRVQTIANNLANVNTAGFKRNLSIFRQREREIKENFLFPKHKNKIHEQVGGGLLIHESYTDLSQGAIEKTGNEYDLAIDGDGYFAVRKLGAEDGAEEAPIYYTRAGNFALDAEGTLVTQDRMYEVLDRDLLPIRIEGTGTLNVTKEGLIEIGGIEAARIGLFRFEDDSVLEKIGELLFKANGGAAGTVVPEAAVNVKQGHIELSGANPITEMANMISAYRGFEANMTMIRQQDQTAARAINDLGRLPG